MSTLKSILDKRYKAVAFFVIAFFTLLTFHLLRSYVFAANFAVTGQALVLNTNGVLDFENYNSNVRVNMTHQYFIGYVFSEDIGWIAFGSADNPEGPVVYDKDSGELSGKAHVLLSGNYIDFDTHNSNVQLNLVNGQLEGYLFSEEVGWIQFDDPGVSVDTEFPVDVIEPVTNASNITMETSVNDGFVIPEGEWSSSFAPYFSWDGGEDDDNKPLKGYCLYLGTDQNADPGNHLTESGTSGLLINSPVSTAQTDCSFIVAGLSLDLASGNYLSNSFEDGETYYLKIKAIDLGSNTYNEEKSDGSAAATYSFQFDSTAPTNVGFINPASGTFNDVLDMNFTWPIDGPGASSDLHSGILGWQYSLNDSGVWRGSTTHSVYGFEYIPVGASMPHYLNEDDVEYVELGDNILYFRSVDKAGLFSSPATYRTGKLAYGGDAPIFPDNSNVTVTPTVSTENMFAFEWPSATAATGRTVEKYYYMINTTPPGTRSTLENNPGTYFESTETSIEPSKLSGIVKGSNVVRVVAVDDLGNYSPSSFIQGAFTLNSENPDPAKNITVSDASIKTAELWRASIAWDHPDYQGTGDITYSIERSEDNENWTQIAQTTGTAYVDTVSESKQFYWRVGTTDTTQSSKSSPSYTNSLSLTPKGSFTEPADLTSGPTVSSLTTRKARISWTTNRPSDSKVAFGEKSGEYFEEEPSNSTQVTEHIINLTNLLPGTTYYYIARWTDEDGNTGESEEFSFTTQPAPTITDPRATQVGLDRAIIRYTVTGASTVRIYYGPTTQFGGVQEIATSTQTSTLTSELTNLLDGSTYYYKINAIDEEGFEYEGQALTFETMPRPRISNVQLQEVAGTAQSTVRVSWEVNTPLSSVIRYSPVGSPDLSRDQVDVELKDGTHQMTISGLLPQHQYQLTVRGRDRSGNEAVSDTFTFTTATDTRPPQISNMKIIGGTIPPVGFAAGEIKAQLVITWDTDEPATAQVEYGEGAGVTYSHKTQEDGNLTTNHTMIISGLTPSKVYHLRAISTDSAGNTATSIDMTTIAPKATRSALDLVLESLSTAFGFLGILRDQ